MALRRAAFRPRVILTAALSSSTPTFRPRGRSRLLLLHVSTPAATFRLPRPASSPTATSRLLILHQWLHFALALQARGTRLPHDEFGIGINSVKFKIMNMCLDVNPYYWKINVMMHCLINMVIMPRNSYQDSCTDHWRRSRSALKSMHMKSLMFPTGRGATSALKDEVSNVHTEHTTHMMKHPANAFPR